MFLSICILEVTEGYAADSYYVLGMGVKILDKDSDITLLTRAEAEKEIDFAGLLLFRNEIKHDSAAAINELRVANIRCLICTGDNALTAVAVARKCGMLPSKADGTRRAVVSHTASTAELDEDLPEARRLLSRSTSKFSFLNQHPDQVDNADNDVNIIYGDLMDNELFWRDQNDVILTISQILLSDPNKTEICLTAPAFRALCALDKRPYELLASSDQESSSARKFKSKDGQHMSLIQVIMPMVRVFARMKPDDKVNVIKILQERGLVVGMAGDGGNDCGALRTA